MKKLLLMLSILLSCCSLFASHQFSWLDGLISLDIFPSNPLFENIKADTYNSSSSLSYLIIPDEEDMPRHIRVMKEINSQKYEDVKFSDKTNSSYLHMKVGLNQGAFRLGIGPVDIEMFLQGALNTVFQLSGGSMALGFDGLYAVGTNISIYDIVTLTFGMQHFSGHLGDELLYEAQEKDTTKWKPLEYVRDNNWLFGISVEPIKYLRLYCTASLPRKTSWVHPLVHIPESTLAGCSCPGQCTMQEHRDGQEYVEGYANTMNYSNSYKAWIVQTGFETNYYFNNLGSIELAFNVKFHQDGQTMHQLGMYSKDNPWEIEYNVSLGFAFDKNNDGGSLSINVSYHNARFPLLNMFYNRSEYISIGLGIVE